MDLRNECPALKGKGLTDVIDGSYGCVQTAQADASIRAHVQHTHHRSQHQQAPVVGFASLFIVVGKSDRAEVCLSSS